MPMQDFAEANKIPYCPMCGLHHLRDQLCGEAMSGQTSSEESTETTTAIPPELQRAADSLLKFKAETEMLANLCGMPPWECSSTVGAMALLRMNGQLDTLITLLQKQMSDSKEPGNSDQPPAPNSSPSTPQDASDANTPAGSLRQSSLGADVTRMLNQLRSWHLSELEILRKAVDSLINEKILNVHQARQPTSDTMQQDDFLPYQKGVTEPKRTI